MKPGIISVVREPEPDKVQQMPKSDQEKFNFFFKKPLMLNIVKTKKKKESNIRTSQKEKRTKARKKRGSERI